MSKMEKIFGVLLWIIILAILSHVAQAQVCEADPCPAGERCFERTALGGTPYVCECTPPRGIGFDCSNADIPYDDLFTCYGRECTSSTFATPNFPSPYPTSYRALFLIFVPGGEEITFQLGFPYDIGPGDFLYLGRGLDFTEADLLRPSISGEFYVFGTDDGTFLPFTLLGDAFWMYFVSDGDNSAGAQGFGILWTARMITNQGPEILNCPQDISLTLQTMSDQIPVTWVEPTSSDPSAIVSSNRSPGQAFDVPSVTTVTYTFTSGQGVSTCSFVITLTSATGDRPPVITSCPTSITEFADDAFSGALIDWRAPDVTDDSPGALEVTQSHAPPEFFAIGEHMVTYTYTDSAGNSATCDFMVTVIDFTPPSFNNCPSDISNSATSPNGAVVEWQRPTASDNSAQVTVTGNFEPGDLFDIGDTTVLYTAVDSSGNRVTCQFTVAVTFTGNVGVTIDNCPADMTVVAENGQTFMFVTWTPPTGQDANGQTIVPTATFQPGSFFRVGTETVVRYTFLSSGGQTDVCSFTVRVIAGVDMGLRVEGCSNDILELAPVGFNFVTVSWTEPIAVDQSGNRFMAEGSQSPGNYFEVGSTTRVTYNFMDNTGNTAQCSFLVTVQFVGDQLDVIGCPNIPIRETIPVGSSTVPVFWTPPTVSENAVVGEVEVLSNFQPGDLFPPGETTVTYSFTDSAGSTGLCSFTVFVGQVQDITPPTVVCPNDISQSIPAGQLCLSVTWEIPFTSDDSGGAVTTSSSPSSGSCLMEGRTTVTVTATDPSGNQATCQFFIMLQATDNEPPTVICPNDIVRSIPLTDGCTQITWEIPFVNDNSGGVVNAVSAPVSGTCFMVNSVTNVVVTAMDPSGNTNTCRFTVTVNELDIVDNNPPFVLCPNDITRNIPIEQGCADVQWEIPFVEDDSGEVTTTAIPPSGTCFNPGMTSVMVTAVDPSGNTDVCGFIVNIIALDFEPPTLTCPDDIVREIPVIDECVNVNWEVPFVSDNSGGNIEVLSTPVSGTCFFVGTTSNVLVTAEDPQGNLARCTFTVTVTEIVTIDTTPPTVLCPSDVTQDIPVEQPCIQVTWEVPFFVDDSGGPVSIASTPNSGSCISNMTTIVTVTATDPSGNENTCNFVISLRPVDNEPPTVICPNDISRNIPILQPCLEVSWEIPFFTDNSGDMVALSSTPPSGSCLQAGRRVVMVTATDPSGNENSCTFVVDLIEIDTEPPSLQCPEDISQTLLPGEQCVEVTWQVPFFNDNSGQEVTITSVPPSGTCFSDSVNVIMVTASDPSNNMNSCTFVVRIIETDPCTPNPCLNGGTCISTPSDNLPFTCLCRAGFTQGDCSVDSQPPSIACPPDISVTLAAGETCAVAMWETPQASDNSGDNVIVISTPESGTCFEPGTMTVQVTAIDQSGNMDQCTFVVDVLEGDTTPPTVVCPQNTAQQTNNGCVVVEWDIPFAFDTGGGQVDTMSDPPSGTCFEIGVNEVVVTATDASGNSATCSFTVTITADVDNIPPVVICPQNIRETLTEGSCIIVEWEIPFSADDREGPVTETSAPPSGTCFEVGRMDVTVTAVDGAGNTDTCSFFVEIVQVVDTTPPVVQNCPTGDVEVTLPLGETCTPIIWMEPSAVDEDGQPPDVLRFPSQPDCFSPGEIFFTYIFTDQAGNIAFCTFNVVITEGQVVDNTPPTVLSCPSTTNGIITTIGGCTEVTWTPPIATDDSVGVLQGVPNIEPGTCFEEGSTTVMYTFTDPSGNMAVCTFEVVVMLIVVDNTPPTVLSCPSTTNGIITTIGGCTEVTWTPPIATDDSVGVLQGVPNIEPGTCFEEGSTTVMYTFTDPSGNMAVCTFEVVVMLIDDIPPEVFGCPDDISLEALSEDCTQVTWVEPQAVDNIGQTVSVETEFSPGQCFPLGVTTVIYTFRDPSGNSAVCRFVVNIMEQQVVDNIPPVVICPQNIRETLTEGSCIIVEWEIPFSVDDQEGPVTETSAPPSGTCLEVGRTDVTVTAVDGAGNTGTCSFFVEIVQVVDTTPPVVQNCPTGDVEVTLPLGEACTPIIWMEPSAVDEDGQPPDVLRFPSQPDCFSPGEILFTYIFTDQAGNIAFCTFSVVITEGQVVDDTPPTVLSCPSNANGMITTIDGCTEVTWTPPIATDDSVGVLQGVPNIEPGTCFEEGSTTVMYTFTDPSGNVAVCTFEVVVMLIDDIPPEVFGCPDDISLEALSEDCTQVTWIEPQAVDNIGLTVSVETEFSPGQCFPLGVTTVIYTFRDPSGNSAVCRFVVNVMEQQVVDNDPPMVIGCLEVPVIAQTTTSGTCTQAFWVEPFAVDILSGLPTTEVNFSPGECFPIGTTNVVYTFTDQAGNQAFCQFEVIVQVGDRDPPQIFGCSMDILQEISPGEDCVIVRWQEPVSIDVVSGIPTQDQNLAPGFCFEVGTTRVIYTFTDAAGNSDTCEFNVQISSGTTPNTPPLFAVCPSPPPVTSLAGNIGNIVSWTNGVCADIEDGNIIPECGSTSGSFFLVGSSTVTCTCTDSGGLSAACSFDVVVVGETANTPPLFAVCPSPPPVTSLAGNIGNIVSWTNGVCADTEDGSITPECGPMSGSFFLVGSSTVTCSCTDSGGLSAECSFDVVVVGETANTPPLFAVCPSPPPVTSLDGNIGNIVSWTNGVCTDTEDGSITPDCTPASGSFFLVGSSSVTCTCTDSGGLSAECTFDAVVVGGDTDPPVLFNCPNAITDQAGPDNTCTRVFWNEPFALDDVSGLAMATQNFAPGDCFNLGVTTVLYTFTDASGNSAVCQFIVNINLRDFLPPVVINCPSDITQQGQPGISCTPVTWTVPTAIDNLPGEIDTFASSSPGDCFPPGLSTVVYQYTDVAGNTESCVFSVFIMVDNVPPVISNCPTDISEQAAPGATCAVIFWSEPNANDAESGIPSLERNFSPGTCFLIGTTEVMYTFRDTAGNEAVCRFQIRISQVIDFTPPAIRNCPMDVTVPGLPGATCQGVFWVPPTATDDVPGDITVTSSADPGDCFPFGQTMVTYTFTDVAGNRASCAFIVQVLLADTTPPQVSNCPTDIFLQAPTGASCQTVVWIEPTAVDNNGGTVFTDSTRSPGDCFPFGTNVVTYTFSDVDGNTAICRFIVNITPLDNSPPVISNCPVDITLESTMSFGCENVIWIEPTAMDETSIPILEQRSHAPGECFPAGPTPVTYQFADLEGNIAMCTFVITIIFRDTDPPRVFGCPADMTVQAVPGEQCAVAQWSEPFAVDNGREDVVTMQTSQPGRCLPIGDTLVSYIFTDGSANVAVCTFTITVFILDVIPPTVTNCPNDITLIAISNDQCSSVNWVEPSGTDESLGPVTIRDQTHFPGNCFPIGQTIVTYVLQDAAGNTASCTFSITINPRDVTPPEIIVCPSDISLEIVSNSQCLFVNWQDPLFVDDSPLEEVRVTQNAFSGTCFEVGTRTVIYTFTDAAGNSATCSFNVEIIRRDFAPPVVTNCPTDITLRMTPNLQCLSVTWIEPTATDESLPITTQVTHPTGTCFEEGETVVTYSFRDAVGNTEFCTFSVLILILDDTPPVITFCPSDIFRSIPPTATCAEVIFPLPTAEDDSQGSVTVIPSHSPGDCFNVGMTSVSYTFIDTSGNLATCMFSIQVNLDDILNPVITSCPSNIMLTLPAGQSCITAAWIPPTATDESGPVTSMVNVDQNMCFPVGQNEVIYTFTDQAGNSATCSFQIIVSPGADVTPPVVVSCPNPVSIMLPPGQPCIVLNFIEPMAIDDSGTVIISSQTNPPSTCFEAGVTQVVYTFQDPSQNEASCEFTVTILSTANTPPLPPVCPTVPAVNSLPGNAGNNVMWTLEDCTDAEDGTITPMCIPVSGSFFSVGSTPVTCTCTDSGGLSTECTFNAVVNGDPCTPNPCLNSGTCIPTPTNNLPFTCLCVDGFSENDCSLDSQPPSVTCPPDISVTLAAGETCAVAMWETPQASDNSGDNVIVISTPASRTCFVPGTTTVQVTATDQTGNINDCTFNVNVIQGANTPPSIPVCPSPAPVTSFPENVGNLVMWTIEDCTDAEDGTITPVCNPPSSNFFTVGANPVTCTCTDSGALFTECTFDAIVVEVNNPPSTPVCPTVPAVTSLPGNAGNLVTWTIGDCTDVEDGPVTPVCNPMPSTFLGVGISPVTCTCTDSGGLITECTFDAIVNAVNAPPSTPVCPTLAPVTSFPENVGNLVMWTIDACTDAEDGTITPVCNPVSNSFFTVGANPVTCTCTDSGGLSTECTFDAVVTEEEDNIPPELSPCPPDQTGIAQAGSCEVINWTPPAATDNSGQVEVSSDIMPGFCFPIGETVVTYTATDSSNNMIQCTFLVTISQDQPPEVLNCPNDIGEIIPIGMTCVIVSWTEPTAVDDTGTVIPTTVPTIVPNTCLVANTYDVVYVFADLANQQTTCMFQITVTPEQVVDTIPPVVLNCPMEDIVRYVQTGMTVSVTWVEPTSTDNSGMDVIVTQNALPGDSFPIGSLRVTYMFMDQAGNSAVPCEFLISVIEDNGVPVVMDCPLDFFVSVSLTERGQIITWEDPTAVDNSGRPVVVEMTGRMSGTFFEIGTNENIVYTFTDEAGNSAICAFTINVAMSTDPLTIENCPVDLTRSAEPGQVATAVSWTVPTATGVMPITVAEPPFQPGDEIIFGTTEIVYQFTDGNNQVADCRFTITVLVTPLILDCPTSFVQDAPPGSQGAIVFWTEPTPMGVEPFTTVFPDNRPNSFLPAGDTIITYMFTDALGQEATCQFTVTVNVLESPPIVISNCPMDFTVDALPGQSTVVTTWTIPSATGFDPVLLTGIPPFEPSVTPLTVGIDVTLTYTFTDGLGMTADCTFTITPRDVTPPSFVTNCPPSPVIQFIGPMDDNTVVTWTVPTAIDDIPGGLVTAMVTPDSDIFMEGNTQVTYTFSDAAGNSISCNFIVTVMVDDIPPMVTFCPMDISVNADPMMNGQIVFWANPTATDNVELSANVDITGGNPNTLFPVGVTTVMYRFSDIFGNTADCIFMVSVIGDTTLPVISGCPLQPVIGYTAVGVPSTVNWVPPTATDTEGGTITTVNTHDPNQSVFQPGTTTVVTYTFTDAFGNAAECSFQVILLEDSTPPIVDNCPSDILISLESGMTQGVAQWIAPTGTDDSGLPVTVERNGLPSGSQFPIGDSVITYTLTNSVGLMAVCTFTVSVRDVTSPQVLNCPTEAIVRYTMTAPVFVELPVLEVTDDTGVLPTLVSSNVPPQSMFSAGSVLVSFVYSDGNGNTVTCTYTVTVIVDNTAPMVVCPDPIQIFVPVGVTTTQVNYPNPTVSDDSGLTPTLVTTIGTASGGIFPVGTPSFVSFLYEDAAGNQGSCTLPVQVTVDNTPPTVTSCTPTVTAFVSATNPQTVVNFDEPMATDDSGLAVTMTVTGLTSGSVFQVGMSTTTYTFTDSVGNFDVCQTVVTVQVDSTPPTIAPPCTPTAMAFASSANPQAVVNFVEPAATDNTGLEVTLMVTGLRSGSLFPAGQSTTIYTFTDSVGNSDSCQTVVTVEIDTTPPDIMNCPSNIVTTVPNTETQFLVNFATPTATDNSGEPTRLSSITGVTADNMYPVGTTTITYTFEDNYSNSATCQFTITISQEVCNPSPCAANEVCSSDGGNPPMAVCTPTSTPCQSNPCIPGIQFCLEIATGFVCIDQDVPDTTAPVISGCPMSPITQTVPTTPIPVFVNTPVPTATDDSNQTPTVTVNGLPANNLFPEGSTDIVYTFTDGSGNEASCAYTVIIDVDYCNPNPCGAVECMEGSPNPAQVVCASPCSSNPCNPFFEFCIEVPSVGFVCSPNGNTPTIPVINNCPTTDITQTVDFTVTPPVFVDTPVPTTTTAGATVDVTGLPAGNLFPEGSTLITYTFTSPDTGQATCTFSVIVDVDYCNPNPCDAGFMCIEGSPNPAQVVCAAQCMLTTCPTVGEFCFQQANVPTCVNIGSNPVLSNCPATAYLVYTMTGIVTFDVPVPSLTNFPTVAATITMNPMGNSFEAGTNTVVTFTFTDDAGATIVVCNVGVSVITDLEPPVVTACPDPRNTVTVNSGTTEVLMIPNPQPQATDNSNQVNVAITGQPANDIYPVGETTVTYTFTDAAGNTATCTFIIAVVVDICSPPPCLANQICVVDTSPQGFFCADQCVDTATCPGQLCFSSIGLMAGSPCVNSLTDPALGNCAPETILALAPFGTMSATVVLPSPFLLNFPSYPVTVNQIPPEDSLIIGENDVFQIITDDVGVTISVCRRTVRVEAAPDASFLLVNCDTLTPINRYVASGTTAVRVFFNEPSTVGGQGVVTLSVGDVRSGSVYPVGTTPVVFTFTDETPSSLQCTRLINVIEDATPPVISDCITPVTITVDSTTTSTEVTISPQPTAVDNSDLPVTVTQSGFPANNVFPVGSTVVSYVFTDSVGNTDTCDITVIVDQDLCNPNPCPAGQTCAEDASMQGFSCTGNVSPCNPSPCPAGEACFELPGGTFVCANARRRRSMDWTDEDSRQERSASSNGEVSLDIGSSSYVMLSYMAIISVTIAATLSTAIVTAWCHWKRSGRGQRSSETASSNI